MKKIITLLLLLITINLSAQLPYTWTTGVNPGWTTSGGANSLTWRATCTVVTTNCNGNYSNNQNTFYTSPTINATCNNASSINITFRASGDAEYLYDFLFLEYSLNNGTTWINPYGPLTGYTGSFGTGYTIPPINVPTSSAFRFRFNFYSDNIYVYSGYKILDFDIWCNTVLPIELLYFKGNNVTTGNLIEWESATEINCSYYQLERSLDAVNWTSIATLNGAGTSTQNHKYNFLDVNITPNIYYYKLTQFDFSGLSESFNIISIDVKGSDNKTIKSIKCYNFLGQEVICNSPGIYLEITEYSNGERLVKQRIQD